MESLTWSTISYFQCFKTLFFHHTMICDNNVIFIFSKIYLKHNMIWIIPIFLMKDLLNNRSWNALFLKSLSFFLLLLKPYLQSLEISTIFISITTKFNIYRIINIIPTEYLLCLNRFIFKARFVITTLQRDSNYFSLC